jgi:hypothetical protein
MPASHLVGVLLLMGAASMTYISHRVHKLAAELVVWIGYLVCVVAAVVLLGA